MDFSPKYANTDAKQWCEKHGFAIDEKRLDLFKDVLLLDAYTEHEENTKLQLATMRLVSNKDNLRQKSFDVREIVGYKETDKGEVCYTDHYQLIGDEKAYNALRDFADCCYVYDFTKRIITVFYDVADAKATLEELQAEHRDISEKERKVSAELTNARREKAILEKKIVDLGKELTTLGFRDMYSDLRRFKQYITL